MKQSKDKEKIRRRIFDIISVGNTKDKAGLFFDIMLVIVILVNISVMFLGTMNELSEYYTIFHIIEFITILLFCIEYVLRIITAGYLYPNESKGFARLHFMRSFEGIIDLFSIIPFGTLVGFSAFRLLKVVRIFRVFSISPTLDSFNIITIVLKDKWKQILSSVIIILVFMLASSLAIYSVETDAQPEAFSNAFSGVWWSMSTLLTIGYGDIYPITVFGKILAFFIAFLGVGLVAIPTGIISAGFVEQYSYRANASQKLPDIDEIGEIRITKDHPSIGKTIDSVEKNGTLRVLLIIRKNLKVIPIGNLAVEENDILVIESERVKKKSDKKSRK